MVARTWFVVVVRTWYVVVVMYVLLCRVCVCCELYVWYVRNRCRGGVGRGTQSNAKTIGKTQCTPSAVPAKQMHGNKQVRPEGATGKLTNVGPTPPGNDTSH